MNYLEKKKNRLIEERKKYLSMKDYDDLSAKKIIKLIEQKSTENIKIKEYIKPIKKDDKKRHKSDMKKFNFIVKNSNYNYNLLINFDIEYYKGKLNIAYKFHFQCKVSKEYYENIHLSSEYIGFMHETSKMIEKVLYEGDKEVQEYLNYILKLQKCSGMIFLINNVLSKEKRLKDEKFIRVFNKKINLKDFIKEINKKEEIEIIVPLINRRLNTITKENRISFYKKSLNKKHLNELLERKEYKKLALLVKSFLIGGFYINNKYIKDFKELKREIKKSELSEYLEETDNPMHYNLKKEIEIYLNQCSIKEF